MLSVVTILAIATGTGCITTQKNMPRPLTSAQIAEVKEALDHHGGWVEYDGYGRSELSYLATGSARPDPYLQSSLVLLAEDPPKAIPLHQVRSLWIRDRSVGAVTGLAAGALTGLAPRRNEGGIPASENPSPTMLAPAGAATAGAARRIRGLAKGWEGGVASTRGSLPHHAAPGVAALS
jgi:hypothetical protein